MLGVVLALVWSSGQALSGLREYEFGGVFDAVRTSDCVDANEVHGGALLLWWERSDCYPDISRALT